MASGTTSASQQGIALGDINVHLIGGLATVAVQGVIDNQRMAQRTQLAFDKDLFETGEGANAGQLAGFNAADRTPVVKP
jgi:hypothetical protein